VLLAALQKQVVEQQVVAYLAHRNKCPHCAQSFRHKDQHPVVFRTLFGNLEFPSPRWFQCACQPHETRTFSPLAELLTEHCSPERLYLETKWASLVSFDLATKMFEDVLPIDTHIHATSVRNHLQRVAKRAEPRPGLAKNSSRLSTDARESGPHCRDHQHPLPSELMVVTLESGMTRRLILK
jgi:hypothetical protein